MTTNQSATSTVNHADFWRPTRDQYLVDPAIRDGTTGKLYFPVPEPTANRWVIVRELYDDEDPYELPTPILIGEFGDRDTADMVCDLIIHAK